MYEKLGSELDIHSFDDSWTEEVTGSVKLFESTVADNESYRYMSIERRWHLRDVYVALAFHCVYVDVVCIHMDV